MSGKPIVGKVNFRISWDAESYGQRKSVFRFYISELVKMQHRTERKARAEKVIIPFYFRISEDAVLYGQREARGVFVAAQGEEVKIFSHT